jgi:hypothetical protein
MTGMFEQAFEFNQDLAFDTSNVVDMRYMFLDAYNFNGRISAFRTQKLTSAVGKHLLLPNIRMPRGPLVPNLSYSSLRHATECHEVQPRCVEF